jgi:hypothetical protein
VTAHGDGLPLKQPGQREIYHPKVVVVAAGTRIPTTSRLKHSGLAGGPRGTTDPFGLG